MAQRKKKSVKKSYSSPNLSVSKSKRKFLDPAEKGKKYSKELRNNTHYTNSGDIKFDVDKDGVVSQQKMTKVQRSYRAGYLDARKDNAKAYNAKKIAI